MIHISHIKPNSFILACEPSVLHDVDIPIEQAIEELDIAYQTNNFENVSVFYSDNFHQFLTYTMYKLHDYISVDLSELVLAIDKDPVSGLILISFSTVKEMLIADFVDNKLVDIEGRLVGIADVELDLLTFYKNPRELDNAKYFLCTPILLNEFVFFKLDEFLAQNLADSSEPVPAPADFDDDVSHASSDSKLIQDPLTLDEINGLLEMFDVENEVVNISNEVELKFYKRFLWKLEKPSNALHVLSNLALSKILFSPVTRYYADGLAIKLNSLNEVIHFVNTVCPSLDLLDDFTALYKRGNTYYLNIDKKVYLEHLYDAESIPNDLANLDTLELSDTVKVIICRVLSYYEKLLDALETSPYTIYSDMDRIREESVCVIPVDATYAIAEHFID